MVKAMPLTPVEIKIKAKSAIFIQLNVEMQEKPLRISMNGYDL